MAATTLGGGRFGGPFQWWWFVTVSTWFVEGSATKEALQGSHSSDKEWLMYSNAMIPPIFGYTFNATPIRTTSQSGILGMMWYCWLRLISAIFCLEAGRCLHRMIRHDRITLIKETEHDAIIFYIWHSTQLLSFSELATHVCANVLLYF